MSKLVSVLGPSGTGKTSAIRNLPPEKTFLINIAGKEIPIPHSDEKYRTKERAGEEKLHNRVDTNSPSKIESWLKRANGKSSPFKYVIIDDIQYLMSFELMRRIKETGWDKFQDIALHFFDVIQQARDMREDLFIFMMGHVAEKDDEMLGLKTVGKAIDQYIHPEGLCTVILQTAVLQEKEEIEERFRFITQTDGKRTARTPMGMFEDMYIPNDLKMVADRMEEYYGMK